MNPRHLVLSLLLIGGMIASTIGMAQEKVLAQEDEDTEGEVVFSVTLADSEYPINPALINFLRIEMEPSSSGWIHTHPGPEIGLVEAGTITAQVNGPARIYDLSGDEEDSSSAEAPTNAEIELESQNLILYLPNTPMTFRNSGDEPASILAMTLLPAGPGAPDEVTYLNGPVTAGSFEGIAPRYLGYGILTVLPRGGITITVDRLRLDPGEPIPASGYPTLLSLEAGILDYEVVSGKVFPSVSLAPEIQSDAAPGTQVSLSQHDAIIFPVGLAEVDRSNQQGAVEFLRVTIIPSSQDSEATPAAEGTGVIRALATEVEETPSAETPAASPEADGTPGAGEPTQTPEVQPTEKGEGALVESNSEGVNVRSGPGTGFEVVFQVFIGDQMRITGESEEADGFVWWPVELVDDPSVTGYIADDFIDLVEE